MYAYLYICTFGGILLGMKPTLQTLHYTVHVNTEGTNAHPGPVLLPVSLPVKEEETMVQFNIDMPKRLRTAIRQKALNMDVPAAVAIRDVLEAWVRQN